MAVENGEEQGLHATATREDMACGGHKVSMRVATLSLQTTPSTNGKWATGWIC